MSDLVITTTGESFSARLERLGPAVITRASQEIGRLTFALREEARRKYDASGLHVRTGALKGSITAKPPETVRQGIAMRVEAVVGKVLAGQKLPYARMQEYGGTIRPKHARFLAIPLEAARTASGVARFAPRQAAMAGYTETFVKNGVLFGKLGKEIVPLFRLKASVTIPARPFMRPALAAMRPEVERGLAAAVASAAAS